MHIGVLSASKQEADLGSRLHICEGQAPTDALQMAAVLLAAGSAAGGEVMLEDGIGACQKRLSHPRAHSEILATQFLHGPAWYGLCACCSRQQPGPISS